MSSKLFLILAFCAIFNSIYASEYYHGFIENLGMDAYVNSEGQDCLTIAKEHVNSVKNVLQTERYDADAVYVAMADFMDMLNYELQSECVMIYGEFIKFLFDTYFDTNELRDVTEINFKKHHNEIMNHLKVANTAFSEGDGYTAGEVHIQILKLVLGFEGPIPSNMDDDGEMELGEDQIIEGFIEHDPIEASAGLGPKLEDELVIAPMPILKRILIGREINMDL